MAIGDNRDYIRVLLYPSYITITGWGVLLMNISGVCSHSWKALVERILIVAHGLISVVVLWVHTRKTLQFLYNSLIKRDDIILVASGALVSCLKDLLTSERVAAHQHTHTVYKLGWFLSTLLLKQPKSLKQVFSSQSSGTECSARPLLEHLLLWKASGGLPDDFAATYRTTCR